MLKVMKIEITKKRTYTKHQIEGLLGLKISSMYVHDMGCGRGTPSYNLTITSVEEIDECD